MSVSRSTSRLVLAAGLLAAAGAPAAAQQPRTLFTWVGDVDREVLLVMRGDDVSLRSRERVERDRTRVERALPRRDGDVVVRVQNGRGDVDVVQQPSARNDYTTVVRIRDAQPGDDRYRIVAAWRPSGAVYGDAGGRWDDRDDWDDREDRRRGRGRGRDDDRWERDRDDDGRYGERDDRRGGYDDRRGDSGEYGGRGARGGLAWRGGVDDVVDIRIQGTRVDYVTRSGAGTRDVRARVLGAGLPDRELTVRVAPREGRGNVWVVQQPTARNGYTAVLRVEDRQRGYGRYDFEAVW